MNYDKVIFNGNILTLEDDQTANALGVNDGKIDKIWFGHEKPEVEANQWINLDGRTLIPGFIDTHNHLFIILRQKTPSSIVRRDSAQQ